MQDVKIIDLWKQTGSTPYAVGAGLHQWLTRNNTFHTDGNSLDDRESVSGGIWFEIPCLGFNHLRITTEFVLANANGYTTSNTSMHPAAFFRGRRLEHSLASDPILGKDLLYTDGNAVASDARLHCMAYSQDTTRKNKVNVAGGMAWDNVPLTHNGTDAQPLIRAANAATGQVRHSSFEVGQASFDPPTNGNAAGYTRTMNGPLCYIRGHHTVYLAIRFVNTAAVTGGSGTPEFGGLVQAVLTR